jgi:hypothetical protein
MTRARGALDEDGKEAAAALMKNPAPNSASAAGKIRFR